jgi:hypothetical protein
MTTRWKCTECETISNSKDLLTAKNPFEPEWEIVGCPKCKSAQCFVEACDEPECKLDASCGFPTEAGYRRTCYDHSEFKKEKQ